MIRSGDRIATGTGMNRRKLTLEEAEAGGLPEPFTKEEWEWMYVSSRRMHETAIRYPFQGYPRRLTPTPEKG
jgi:hypothetical protein